MFKGTKVPKYADKLSFETWHCGLAHVRFRILTIVSVPNIKDYFHC